MDSFREWISDNLRYILLVLALILVLAVAIVGVRTISNIASGKTDVTTEETETTAATESETNNDVIVETEAAETSSSLVKNDAKVLTTMTSYYAARTNGDTETLQKLEPSAEEDTSAISDYVESYSNVNTYSVEGPTSGNYVVYVCYDGKVKDIDTLVPSLTQFYLKSNDDGSLYIADWESDDDAKAFVEETRSSDEVQSLIDSVSKSCEEAENSDPALKEFMKKYGNSQSSSDEETDSSEMVANDECNIRAEASTDGEVLGGLYIGETVTKLGETDDGWTMIDYNGVTAYVKSEFLSEPDSTSEDGTTDDSATDDGTTDDGTADDGTAYDDSTYTDDSSYDAA